MNTMGDAEGKRQLVEEQHCLWQACPSLVSAEAWFSPPRPKGNELASLIIPCCNQLEYTRQCLESVLRHTREPYELLLVDNGSSDGTLGYLEEIRRRRRPARTVVLHNETNRGFVAACNQALEETKGKYVVFLNNDTIVTPGWLEGLIGWLMKEWPNAGLVGPVSNGAMDWRQCIRPGYTDLADLDAFAALRRQTFSGKTQVVLRLTGFCLLVRREVLGRLGRLDERYGMGFFEDDYLCVRRGKRVIAC